MKDILDKLLKSEVLTEDTVSQLTTAINEAIESAKTTAREDAILEAKTEVARQWEVERTALIESIDEQITDGVTAAVAELNETREQLESLKVDLSARYVRREQQLAESVRKEMQELQIDLDTFMKTVIEAHLATVTDDIKAIKEDNFGRRIYKAFAREFAERNYGADEMKNISAAVKSSEVKLNDALSENASLRAALDEAQRQTKMKDLLTPLTGEKRKVMEALLANTPTTQLEERYRTYLSRVLKGSEKETKVLAEGKTTAAAPTPRRQPTRPQGRLVTGDSQPLPTRSTPEQLNESAGDDEMTRHLQRVAGIRV